MVVVASKGGAASANTCRAGDRSNRTDDSPESLGSPDVAYWRPGPAAPPVRGARGGFRIWRWPISGEETSQFGRDRLWMTPNIAVPRRRVVEPVELDPLCARQDRRHVRERALEERRALAAAHEEDIGPNRVVVVEPAAR